MDVPPGSTDLLLKKLLKIKNLSIFILIQLLHCLMNNKISLQFVITGGTMFYMIQESLKFIHRQAVVNKRVTMLSAVLQSISVTGCHLLFLFCTTDFVSDFILSL